MNLAGVVVLFNPQKDVLESINTYLGHLSKLYLIDNSSYSNEKLFSTLHNVEYVPNYKNLGIAQALNMAAEMAVNNGNEYLLTMDQDSQFVNDGIDVLINTIENYSNNKKLTKTYGDDVTKVSIFTPLHCDNDKPIEQDLSYEEFDSPINCMTSGNIINLKIWKKIGGFEEKYFIDCVDFEYCLKTRKNGYQIIRCNNSKLLHKLGQSTVKTILGKKFVSFEHNHIRRYYIVRNRCYLCSSYKDDFPDYIKLESKCTKRELCLVWICERNKIKKTFYMLKGYIDFKKNIVGGTFG